MGRRLLKLLFRSLDSELSSPDRARLEAGLRESEELRRRRTEILAVRRAAADSAAGKFGPGFADRVLAAARAGGRPEPVEPVFEALLTVFKPVAVAAAALLVLLVIYSVSRGELIPKGEVYYASDITMNRVLELSSFF